MADENDKCVSYCNRGGINTKEAELYCIIFNQFY
jgi:hypothetical protein